MGQLEHPSFKSHKYWGKHWLATKYHISGRTLAEEIGDAESAFSLDDLLDQARYELQRLHNFGYRHGLGHTVSKDDFIVDGSGKVHLINFRKCNNF